MRIYVHRIGARPAWFIVSAHPALRYISLLEPWRSCLARTELRHPRLTFL